MAKANYVHDGPPPGIGLEAPLPSDKIAVDDADISEVPDLLSHFDAFDPANSFRIYSDGTPGTEPLYYSLPWPEGRLPSQRSYRANPVL